MVQGEAFKLGDGCRRALAACSCGDGCHRKGLYVWKGSPGMPANPTPSSPNAQSAPLTAALSYARRGWAVFPLHTLIDGVCDCRRACGRDAGKHPRTSHGLTDATTDEGQIR